MAKAKPEATTAWISYSQAKALAGEYLGNVTYAERELLKGLEAAQIPWQCVRFDAPEGYSGPGRGDPKFWKVDPDKLCTRDGPVVVFRLRGVHIKGDSAERIDGATAYGIELDRSALVRLKLLRQDSPRAASPAPKKGKAWQVDRVLPALRDPELFPNGTDGIPTNVAHPKVVKYLQPETKRLGLSDPSWDSVDRALKIIRSSARSA